MHPIPKGKPPADGSDPILYSEAAIALTDDDRAFIQRRLRHSLGGRARPVVEDPSLSSVVPGMLRDLLSDSSRLVEHSCALAKDLYSKQKWVSPGGLVMTVIGSLGSDRCVVVAKMEHQEGMRVEQTTNESGQRTFKAEHLRDLILGDGTRVFKVGLFTTTDGAQLDGHVVDDQQVFGGIAHYFIDFLGCAFRQQADMQTQTYLDLAQKFFDQRTKGDPELYAAYEIALLADMQSSVTEVRPEKFAMEHLQGDDQDLFMQRVREAALPTKAFTKDVSLIRSRIRRMRISTERGADVFAPPDMFDDGSLTVECGDEDLSLITVRDAVKKIHGASGKRVD